MNDIVKTKELTKITPQDLREIHELAKDPTVMKTFAAITGVGATLLDQPGNLVLSVGRLAQSLLQGTLIKQWHTETNEYIKKGQIPKENLETPYGKSIFVGMLKAIDEEGIDGEKFEALKSIFFNTVWIGTDEHSQMLGYEYFLQCKKLKSIDILILKTAYEIYQEPDSGIGGTGPDAWENLISKKLGIPRELAVHSRLQNSVVNNITNIMIFDTNMPTKHGLTNLGIEIGKYLTRKK